MMGRHLSLWWAALLLTAPLLISASSDDDDDNVVENESDLFGVYGVFGANLLGVVASAIVVVFRYSDNRNNSIASAFMITMGAVSAAGLLALFPADVGQALGVIRGNLSADTFGPTFKLLYRLGYWSSMIIAFVALPSLELVIRSGAFGLGARIADALAQIVKLVVGLILVAGLFTFIFVAAENDWYGLLQPILTFCGQTNGCISPSSFGFASLFAFAWCLCE
jgi:hypothetical protein